MSTLADLQLTDDRQFSSIVIDYQNQVANIIQWLYNKEEELKKRPHETDLEDGPFSELLEEFSVHERFISELCEYCQTIMKGKEDGQEMRENIGTLSEEDLDEIGIQMDSMLVCYEKLKILATDRLRNLQRIIEVRQQAKIEKFESWLTDIAVRISGLNNIGPNYDTILRQLQEMHAIQFEIQKQQDFLNSLSSLIFFDEVDAGSLEIRSGSSEILDKRIQRIDRQWTELCQVVEARSQRLQKAESIWKILSIEGPQLVAWLDRTQHSLNELSGAVRNMPDFKSDPDFASKLMTRSNKIDLDIKQKQSFYTNLENRVRTEIEKFDDPCSMFVIELEKKLEEMQDHWNTIMNQKRTLDFNLQTLSDPAYIEQTRCNMTPIPIVDPEPARRMVNSASDPKGFENSLSSESRSLLNCNNNGSTTYTNDSHDDISSTSMTASYSMNMAPFGDGYPASSSQLPLQNNNLIDHQQHRNNAHLTAQHFLESNTAINQLNDNSENRTSSHNCRVEEWKHSLESFTTWLKRVEASLAIDRTASSGQNGSHPMDNWARLNFQDQLDLLNEIEQQICTSCQDEFDCLILQGQQIIEDLMPEIAGNEYEVNMKDILADLEIRYSSVKRCLSDRKYGLADKGRWLELLSNLRGSSDIIVEKMGQIMPENSIGVDLITLAQQQDHLMHSKADLDEDKLIQGSLSDAKLFLKLCDNLRKQHCRSRSSLMMFENVVQQQQHGDGGRAITSPSNEGIWLSFKDLKEDIEVQLDRLTLHYSELSQLIEDRLERLNEVHKEMHALQYKMQELATELQVAEIMKSSWPQLDDLTIEQLSEQLEDLKLFRERFIEIQSAHKTMNSIFEWMTQADVPLSQSNLKRISELNTIYSLIEVSIDERQKLIEQAFDNQSSSEQRFLIQTIADLPKWERRVATSKVPYFIDHDTNKTRWDHPKFSDMLKSMSDIEQYLFSAYRTALKLRFVQNKLGINLLMLEQLKEIFTQVPEPDPNQQTQKKWNPIADNNDALVGVEQIIFYLKSIYDKVKSEENPSLDVPLSVDLTLNWLLNLFDSTRTGYINGLSLKVGLSLLCCATREEKYIYMYDLVADKMTRTVDARKLGTLFESCIRVPIYLGEGESFGGTDMIETSTRECFSKSKFNPQHPNSIDLADYLDWLKSEPQFIIWLPVLHRLLISQNTKHPYKCKLCGKNPIVGLRYRCLKCLKFHVCQECFLTGRHVFEHHNPEKHPMQEYCSATSSGENVRDLTRILRNKMRIKFRSSSSSRKQAELQ